jgi:predicted amino acid racemase
MSAPRLDVDLDAIGSNTRSLVDRLASTGIRVTGVTKAALGSPGVAGAMLRGGATGLGDSRVENLARLETAGVPAERTLIRSPMLSQVDAVVRHASTSLNTEISVLEALSRAATRLGTTHAVVLMVELGDLREGVLPADLLPLALDVRGLAGLRLAGIGTNLACQSGIVPDRTNMDALSVLATEVEHAVGAPLTVVSGGNSANLGWALTASDTGRVDELRLGEAILLGLDPLSRLPITGLQTDAFSLVAELIEVRSKPATSWGDVAQTAFGAAPARRVGGLVRQGILAVGRQDVEPDGLVPPDGVTVLGTSSDHLVVDLGDHAAAVGDELTFGVGYGALLRAMTSPFVTVVERALAPVSVPTVAAAAGVRATG